MPEKFQVWIYLSPMVVADLPSFADLHKCRSTLEIRWWFSICAKIYWRLV